MGRKKQTERTKLIINFNEQSITFHFQITTKNEFKELTEVIKFWYNLKSFKIREYHLGTERMLLLDSYRSYEEIQSIKKELGIESMYE